ncbi:MAG: sodium:proline symporter, partial [Gammaproteobacteria bacterium]|nr:sodium:proline symporter [Gammaproteobacteria bacterium]
MENNATLVTFIAYLITVMAIGIYAYRQTNDLSDYILGGRRLGKWVTALSAGASDMSGWLLLGLPGAIYAGGFGEAWIAVGLTIGAYWNWKITAPRLRAYTEHFSNSLTLPDYFSNRFNDDTRMLRVLSAVIILVFFTVYVASGLTGGAKLFEASFGMDYYVALFVGGAVIISYTFVGGFLAVSWTDLVQGLLMAAALVIAPLVMIYELGGLSASLETAQQMDIVLGTHKSDLFAGMSAGEYLVSFSFLSLMA